MCELVITFYPLSSFPETHHVYGHDMAELAFLTAELIRDLDSPAYIINSVDLV